MARRAGDVRIENVPDASLVEPTDALVRVSRACICGSDLWPYKLKAPDAGGQRMGHEAIGVVEAVGAEVRSIKAGDFVIMPFAFSDGTCDFCQEGLQTACVHGGFFGNAGINGAQAEALARALGGCLEATSVTIALWPPLPAGHDAHPPGLTVREYRWTADGAGAELHRRRLL